MSTKAIQFETRPVDLSKDLGIIQGWWAEHDSPVDLEGLLPEDGLIIDDVCAAWVYLPLNHTIAMIGWSVSNPRVSPRMAHAGLITVISELADLAKRCGATHVSATLMHTGLVKVFKRMGFIEESSTSSILWGKV